MTKFSPVIAVVDALESKANARRARILAAYKEANSGLEPTTDIKGRYHAPCDGYMLPDGYSDLCQGDYSERIFGAGEYLPTPVIDEEHEYNRDALMWAFDPTKYQYRQKAKTLLSDFEELKAMAINGVELNHGKAWDESGQSVAYAYINGLKTLVDACAANLESLYTANKANKPKAPEVYLDGRQTVTGKILATKIQNDERFGPSVKMLVGTEDGCRLWGTMPRALPQESVDSLVTFTATFAKGSGGMTYFSRPTGAMIVNQQSA